MSKLILIRHGQSEWNELNLFTGWKNPGLTKKGEKEATDAGKLLREKGIKFESKEYVMGEPIGTDTFQILENGKVILEKEIIISD